MVHKRLWRFVVAGAVVACGAAQAGPMSASIDMTQATHYLWRGYDLLGGAKFPIQPGVTVTHESGLSASLWASYALLDRSATKYADESDFTLGYSRTIAEGVGLSLGGVYYHYPNDSEAKTSELYVGATFSSIPLSPSITAYYDTKWLDGSTVEASGWYFLAGVSHSVPVSGVSFELSAGLGLASNDSFDGCQDLSLTAGTTFAVGPIGVSPWVSTALVFQDAVNTDDIVYSAGVTLSHAF